MCLHAHDEDTIAAISTPSGEGGIGIVRLSGPQAITIAWQMFRGAPEVDIRKAPAYSLHYGYVVHPQSQEILDETLISVMRAPRSYTREDVIEINCHGGMLPLRNVLELTLHCGARLAAPGEFTKRAFLNGRIDLSQAESVIDIIRAKTDAGLTLAIRQLRGKLSQRIATLHTNVKHLLATIEAGIDFPEDDIELISTPQILLQLQQSLVHIDYLLATAREGKILRDGLTMAIVGKPNVGKSSLLNVFLEEERAIVTPIPGTTRDTIEDYINLNGVPVRLIDTAGIRSTGDQVEQLGVERSRQIIARADMVLCLFDVSAPLSSEDEELLAIVRDKTIRVILNKIDLPLMLLEQDIMPYLSETMPTHRISITERQGLNELKQAITDEVLNIPLESVEITNIRHKRALTKAQESFSHALHSAEAHMSHEFIALDIREGLNHLGEITGETTTDDILNDIFSTFCIGK